MIQEGSNVKIHYKLMVDGELVDTSQGGEPLAYVQGAGQIVPGLEEHLAELSQGAESTVEVPPEKGFGVKDPQAVQTVPRSSFEDPESLKTGMLVQGQTGDGKTFNATVSEISDSEVTLDLNHPLAGKTLEFQVEIVEVS